MILFVDPAADGALSAACAATLLQTGATARACTYVQSRVDASPDVAERHVFVGGLAGQRTGGVTPPLAQATASFAIAPGTTGQTIFALIPGIGLGDTIWVSLLIGPLDNPLRDTGFNFQSGDRGAYPTVTWAGHRAELIRAGRNGWLRRRACESSHGAVWAESSQS